MAPISWMGKLRPRETRLGSQGCMIKLQDDLGIRWEYAECWGCPLEPAPAQTGDSSPHNHHLAGCQLALGCLDSISSDPQKALGVGAPLMPLTQVEKLK